MDRLALQATLVQHHPGRKERPEPRDQKVNLDQLVCQVSLVNLVQEARKGPAEDKVPQVCKVQQGYKGLVDSWADLGPAVLLGHKEALALRASWHICLTEPT